MTEFNPATVNDDEWTDVSFPPHIGCPVCNEPIPFAIQAILKEGHLYLRPILTDVWAHSFTHEGNVENG